MPGCSWLSRKFRIVVLCFFSLNPLFLAAPAAYGQVDFIEVDAELMHELMPDATHFSEKAGEPPVYSAFRSDPNSAEPELIGYLFETPDLPPEEVGYSAPIDVLVGIDLTGMLTGIKVLYYRESYKSIRGDFINSERFPNQFEEKNIIEGFRVGRDVDGISRATITSWAVSRGVRNAARRVAEAYLSDSDYVNATNSDAIALRLLADQSWDDMLENGMVKQMDIDLSDGTELRLSLAFMGHDGLGDLLVGSNDYSRADREASNRVKDGHMVLVGIDGDASQPFRQERLAIEQGDSVYQIERRRFVYVGSADDGKIAGRVRFAGAMVLDPSTDISKPFNILYNVSDTLANSNYIETVEYSVPPIPLALALGNPVPAELLPIPGDDVEGYGEEGAWASLINNAPWAEVFALLVLFALVMTAFLRKSSTIRWAALTMTLFYLGWMDGGFVSVSHITNGIKLGPSMFLNDLPLLLIIIFTIVTTLIWGRVFCSSLCPFGALQDFIAHFVPKRFQKELTQAIHDKAIYLKYGVLAFLVLMAIFYSELSLFQYFEPFGTVFYISRSAVLWGILVVILLASTVVKRAYCRYACPLGAALGVASFLSPWKIERVQQCQVCKVCEHACPTGAIHGHVIDFKECVRCDICERKLITKAGVCKHTVEEVSSRHKAWTPIAVG